MRQISLAALDIACNSIDAGADTVRLNIALAEPLEVEIIDNGPGMSKEAVGLALKGGYSSKGSSGMGLSLARREAESVGGRIDVDSSERGTSVRLVYPGLKGEALEGMEDTIAALLSSGISVELCVKTQKGIYEIAERTGEDAPAASIIEARKRVKIFIDNIKEIVMKKTIQDINAIREAMQPEIILRDNVDVATEAHIVVAMGTVGINAGARTVFNALVDEVEAKELKGVRVTRCGAIGDAADAPIVEVHIPGKEVVTYKKVDVKKAIEIIGKIEKA